jgi:hypothetical protein
MSEFLNVLHRNCLVLGSVQSSRQDAGGEDARSSVFKQIRHPLGSGQTNREAVPPDWGSMVVRSQRIIDPETGGVVSGGSGDGQEFGEPGGRGRCSGQDEAFIRGELHAEPLDFPVGGLGGSNQEVLTLFDADVGRMYAEVVDV